MIGGIGRGVQISGCVVVRLWTRGAEGVFRVFIVACWAELLNICVFCRDYLIIYLMPK